MLLISWLFVTRPAFNMWNYRRRTQGQRCTISSEFYSRKSILLHKISTKMGFKAENYWLFLCAVCVECFSLCFYVDILSVFSVNGAYFLSSLLARSLWSTANKSFCASPCRLFSLWWWFHIRVGASRGWRSPDVCHASSQARFCALGPLCWAMFSLMLPHPFVCLFVYVMDPSWWGRQKHALIID